MAAIAFTVPSRAGPASSISGSTSPARDQGVAEAPWCRASAATSASSAASRGILLSGSKGPRRPRAPSRRRDACHRVQMTPLTSRPGFAGRST
ncbi:MAG TPA: hypothetical protein VFH51_11110 [Myxococcota bacterium]|nr:hypothetical protein [Myxococcota bacterium]